MTATNHVITGAVIGAWVANPVIALSAALMSHIILDVLPHADIYKNHTSRKFLYALMIDMGIAASILITIALSGLEDWQLLVLSGISAASLDLWHLPYWILDIRGTPKKMDRIGNYLEKIQRYERPWGIYVEIIWFILMLNAFLALTS